MSNLTDKVVVAKNALMLALGDNVQAYMNNMKQWFRYKWSKEEFDYESRKLLSAEAMHLHNQFLLAILNKIDAYQTPKLSSLDDCSSKASGSSSNSSRKRKRSSKGYFERVSFEPYDFLDLIVDDSLKFIQPNVEQSQQSQHLYPNPRYSVQELFLPDAGFILGRFLIGSWEAGLKTVDDNVAEYVALGVRILLKNLIGALLLKQKNYKVTGEGTFYYDIGADLKDPEARNTVTRQKVDDAPLEIDKEITSPSFLRRVNEDIISVGAFEQIDPPYERLITLKDCQRAFNDRNLIKSHAVFSVNMERLTQMLH